MMQMNHVTFAYGAGMPNVLQDLNLTVTPGEFLCIIGHSGCGKSTLLRLAAGLDAPSAGEILVDDVPVRGPSCQRAIVFQQYSLFPWMTVRDNVLFALSKTGRFSKKESAERAAYFLEQAGMLSAAEQYPYQLSGGMRQRTAIARALAMDAPYLLLDEPFGALDTKIRSELQQLLYDLWEESGKTVLFVTHDLEEALILASRIVFLRDGRVWREKTIARDINCCCREELGQPDCLALKEELAGWYQ